MGMEDKKSALSGRLLQKKREIATEGEQEVGHRKRVRQEDLPAKRKGHVVSHMVCLTLVSSAHHASQNQLTMGPEVSL